ncbi:MAG: polymer-forming cytoskeletal protein [Porticoccaceae bacterium]|nr:polymer-forming cytoskeletal protein [Pseudomonadales bacterium]MCP5172793.1 polymer-forming cytoskeletal protein [Pseudomonadales bacterium]MCP5302267.1 polymer-forming cytoskeletal protein [Pseudomonadales bacterium]
MQKKKGVSTFSAGSTTLIASGTHVVGDIRFQGNLEIEGEVTGNIIAEDAADARVRVLQQGHVRGDIKVPSVVINGHVEGTVAASSHVELAAKAVVEGDVHYAIVEIEKGARINGNFVHESAQVVEMSSAATHVVEKTL